MHLSIVNGLLSGKGLGAVQKLDAFIDILESSPICTFCLNQASYLPSQLLDFCNANLKIYGRVMEI
jgi:hypothetical protein